MADAIQAVGGDTGVKELKIDSAIRFSHPGISDDLVVLTGANSIKWHYTLNTNVTPTIGGEVTQILSAYVGPMMIGGMASSNAEMKRIKNWFETYFEIAGTAYRDDISYRNERAVTFHYPARGWSFYIDPTEFQGWRFDKAVWAVPWSMTAEIVSDNALNYLSGVTMTSFTGPLANPAFIQVGYSDPTGTGKASMFVNPLLSSDIPGLAKTMGDNFQRLIASFATGNFQDFAFGYTKDFQLSGLPKDINAEYTKAFGSPYIVGGQNQTGGGGSGSGTITYGQIIQNPTTQAQVVQDIATIFESNQIPAQLGVAVAYNESHFDPNAWQPPADCVNCGAGLFQVNRDGSGRGNGAMIRAGAHDRANGGKFTDGYPPVSQIKDAAGWFSSYAPNGTIDPTDVDQMAVWAQRAQAPPDGTYATLGTGKASPTFRSDWGHAGTYLQAISFSSNGNLVNPFPGGWVPSQLDMGYDGNVRGNKIVAPFDGTITYVSIGASSGWGGGYLAIKADKQPSALAQATLYFAEGCAATRGKGAHVHAGDKIADLVPSGSVTNPPNVTGLIEWGVASDASPSTPYAQVLGLGSAAAKNMVIDFYHWAQNSLNVPGSSTNVGHAGTA